MGNHLRIAFAGDRDISVKVLRFIQSKGISPLALILPDRSKASHADELMKQCPFLPLGRILFGDNFRQTQGLNLLKELCLDFIIGIHFPYFFTNEVLAIPGKGVLNLHPSYLPYNRGWHTPSWAILEDTPFGATLHFMDSGIDTGDVIYQERIHISPGDTAHTLYQRVKQVEFDVFVEGWSRLLKGGYKCKPQDSNTGTSHTQKDLLRSEIQKINLEEDVRANDLIRRLRALTTDRVHEAAYYEVDGRRFRIQVLIHEEPKV